ncbi:hypothetical protein D3C87_1529310 [compost metagenome]
MSGVWTAAEDRSISFANMQDGQGAAAAMPVFALYMQKVYADKNLKYTKGDFELPEGGLTRVVDCSKYWGGGGSSGADSTGSESNLNDDRLGF